LATLDLSPEALNTHGLHRLDGAAEADAHIVFVHGLSGSAFDTWAHDKGAAQTYWPGWLAQDERLKEQRAAVWTYGYDASPTVYQGKSEALGATANTFFQQLEIKGLLGRPIVVVAHSLGGLVTKTMLRKLSDLNHKARADFNGVVFFGTPHLGSPVKSALSLFDSGASELAKVLDFSHPTLRELNDWYRNQWPTDRTLVFVEGQPQIANVTIVPIASASPGQPGQMVFSIPASHTGMCKMSSTSDTSYQHVVSFVLRSLASPPVEQLAPYEPKAPRRINIPPSIGTRFVGRDAELQALHHALQAHGGQDVALSSYALHGMGGYGKTRLVVEYAHRFEDAYSCVLLLNAESPQSLDADLAALCEPHRLSLGGPHELPKAQADRVDMAKRWLVHHTGWLLIADNADTTDAARAVAQLVRDCPQGQVLVTTRLADWGGTFVALPLQGLPPAAAKQLLLAQSTPGRHVQPAQDPADLDAIVIALHGHSLALTLAAAYIGQRRISFGQYLSDLRAQSQRPLHWLPQSALAEHDKSVTQSLRLSIDAVGGQARQLLDCLAWLAPEPLPRSLCETPCKGVTDVTDALTELEQHHLVEKADGAPAMHRLLQEVLRGLQAVAAPASGTPVSGLPGWQAALQWTRAAFEGDPDNPDHWPRLVPLAPHVDQVLHAVENEPVIAPPHADTVALLCNQCGVLRHSEAQFASAEPLYRRALAIDEASYGESHPNVARNLNNLASLLYATNRLAEAEPLIRRALAINEASYGGHHPNVAAGLNNLAELLRATNRLAEAEPLYRRALAINEASYGGHHPNVATGLNNLAELLRATNRLAEAEPLIRRALAINEASYGEHHPKLATCLNNLAGLLKSTNRLAEAEPLYRRALAIDEASYGERHPNVARNLNNLASLLYATNRLAESEPLIRRALAIDEASHGEYNPAVAAGLNNLAELLRATNRLAEAEPLYRRALGIDEASYGEHHPNVAIGLNNLAGLLESTNRLAEAEPLYRRALTIFVDFTLRTGHTHPYLLDAVANYFDLLHAMQLPANAVREKLQTVLSPLQADPRFHDLALSLLTPTE
jgi:CII-binding regulator of phage lambda lysogenization HflD